MPDNTMSYTRDDADMGTIERGQERIRAAAEKTKESLYEAKDRTSRAVQRGYSQTMEYGRQHPERLGLIMLGSGIAIGMLLASRMKSRSSQSNQYKRVARPLVDALADVGRMLTR